MSKLMRTHTPKIAVKNLDKMMDLFPGFPIHYHLDQYTRRKKD